MKRALRNFAGETSGFVVPVLVLIGVIAILRALEDFTLLGICLVLGLFGLLYILGFLMKGAGWRMHGPD